MASSSAAATDLLITQSEDETPLPAESKELTVTMTTEGLQPHVGAEVPSSNGATDTPLPVRAEEEDEATPTPPESSSLSSDIETVTVATTEEESLLVLLRQIKTDSMVDQGGEPGKGSDQGRDGGLVQVLDFVVDQPDFS